MRASNYGIKETLQNVIYLFKTKIAIPKARLIRYPIIIRGKKYIDFGRNLTTGRNCRIEVNGVHSEKRLFLGENVNIGDYVSIRCANKISIGSNVLMGSHVLIIDNSHGKYKGENQSSPNEPPNERALFTSEIVINDNVWIGENSVIQMGVTIGYGSVVAANSIVTKDVPAKSIVAGIPAKIIKVYDEQNEEWVRV